MKNIHYTDLLHDIKFVRWQLAPDESLDIYWNNLIETDPHLEKEIHKAASYLKNEGLNKNYLSTAEREELLNRIQFTIKNKTRYKLRQGLIITAAACAAFAILVVMLTQFFTDSVTDSDIKDGMIVGELLNNEDVQLVTSNNTILFDEDIDISLDEKGIAQVSQSNKEIKKIELKKDELNSLIVPFGKRTNLILADGTKVWLNSGTVLEFPAQFNEKEREIKLKSGEIYIEVAHDNNKPFYVMTQDIRVEVLGTSFNVTSYNDLNSTVVLLEGNVSLTKNGINKKVSLHPNELAIYNSESMEFDKMNVDVENYTSWKDGYLSLNKTPMTEVLQQVGRYYNLSFNFDKGVDLQKRSCTGKIQLSENLDNVMKTISLLTSTSYEIENNRIYITNEID
ncbi:MAG: FecR domain-containing protein [Fermentimonas sp.]|nr:FecR domain-containing protein [Fermentimonas sp.]